MNLSKINDREGLEKMEREKQRQLERQQAPTSPESESPAASGNVKQVSSKSLTTPVNLLNITNVVSRAARLWLHLT